MVQWGCPHECTYLDRIVHSIWFEVNRWRPHGMCAFNQKDSDLHKSIHPRRYIQIWFNANLVKCVKREKMAGLFWSVTEITALLNLWGDISMQRQLDGVRRKRPVFSRILLHWALYGCASSVGSKYRTLLPPTGE